MHLVPKLTYRDHKVTDSEVIAVSDGLIDVVLTLHVGVAAQIGKA